MNHLVRLLTALLLLALTACPSKKAEPAQPGATAAAPLAPASAAASGASYEVYRGQLSSAADSITLHLTITPLSPGDEQVGGLAGSYYGADGEPHELQQLRLHPDSLLLTEYSRTGYNAGGADQAVRWLLRRQPDGRLTGTRANAPLVLRRMQLPLSFVVRVLADSVPAYPTKATSPYGHIGLQTLVPVGGPSAPATQALAANILRQQRDDSLPNLPAPTLASLWQQQRQHFTKFYQEDVASLTPDPTDPADTIETPSYALRYEEQQTTSVLCHQGPLLSLGFFSYNYTGGAHGGYGTTVRSFDLRTGRALTFDDIFRPGAKPRLLPLLDRAVRRTLGLAPTDSLNSALFVNQMTLTPNVCLTPGGVLFVYVPYEIASYADGEIRVFVPLAEVRPLLRAGLPLPGGEAL